MIELMVVLAILVMMGAIFPFVLKRALPHERVVMGSQRLRAAIHAAQTLSQDTGEPKMLDTETPKNRGRFGLEGTHESVMRQALKRPDVTFLYARFNGRAVRRGAVPLSAEGTAASCALPVARLRPPGKSGRASD